MTKKHFEAIAKAIADTYSCFSSMEHKAERIALDKVAKNICDVCAESNPRFDEQRFLRACGMFGE